jgi:hypothetical protein
MNEKKNLFFILILCTLAILSFGCQKSEMGRNGGKEMISENTSMSNATREIPKSEYEG